MLPVFLRACQVLKAFKMRLRWLGYRELRFWSVPNTSASHSSIRWIEGSTCLCAKGMDLRRSQNQRLSDDRSKYVQNFPRDTEDGWLVPDAPFLTYFASSPFISSDERWKHGCKFRRPLHSLFHPDNLSSLLRWERLRIQRYRWKLYKLAMG